MTKATSSQSVKTATTKSMAEKAPIQKKILTFLRKHGLAVTKEKICLKTKLKRFQVDGACTRLKKKGKIRYMRMGRTGKTYWGVA